jgi:chemotaxis protein methyltransferase CheR
LGTILGKMTMSYDNNAAEDRIENINAIREFHFTKDDFEDIARRIYSLAGIVLKDHKVDMVYGRLARRLRTLNYTHFAQYRDYLDGPEGHKETQNLVNSLTTNLTSFFREEHHFEHLKKEVLSQYVKKPSSTRFRIWSSASSTGEEPYTIAMTLHSAGVMPTHNVKILATDLDTNVLKKGASGIYSDTIVNKLPGAIRQEYFRKHDEENYIVRKELQQYILFKQLNLLSKWPMNGPFDIIFCRNVLIYFDQETRKMIVNRMIDLLPPGGFLYLGHSESIASTETRVSTEGHTIFRKKG